MRSWCIALRNNVQQKKLWGALLGALFVGGLSAYILYSLLQNDADEPTIFQMIEQIGSEAFLHAFLMASFIYIFLVLSAVIGWGWIMGLLSNFWHWPQHFRIYAITIITRRLPGSMWYMLGRIVMYERFQVRRSVTAVASGVEFATIFLGAIVLTLLTWPIALSGRDINPLWLIFGLLAGVLLLNPPVLQRVIRRLSRQNSEALQLRYRHLLGWISIYVCAWIGGGTLLFVLSDAIHPLPWASLPIMLGIWSTVGVIGSLFAFVPFSIGVQEISLATLLSPYTGTTEALIIALLMRVVLTLNEILWALIAGLLGLTGLIQTPTDEQTVTIGHEDNKTLPDAEKPQEVSQSASLLPPK